MSSNAGQTISLSSSLTRERGIEAFSNSIKISDGPTKSSHRLSKPAKAGLCSIVINAIELAARARQLELNSKLNLEYAHTTTISDLQNRWMHDLSSIRGLVCSADGDKANQGLTLVPALSEIEGITSSSSRGRRVCESAFSIPLRSESNSTASMVNGLTISKIAERIQATRNVEQALQEALRSGTASDVAAFLSKTTGFNDDEKAAYLAQSTLRDVQDKLSSTTAPGQSWVYKIEKKRTGRDRFPFLCDESRSLSNFGNSDEYIDVSLGIIPSNSSPNAYEGRPIARISRGEMKTLVHHAFSALGYARMARDLTDPSSDEWEMREDLVRKDVRDILAVLSSHIGDPAFRGQTVYLPTDTEMSELLAESENRGLFNFDEYGSQPDTFSAKFEISPSSSASTYDTLDGMAFGAMVGEGVILKTVLEGDSKDVVDYVLKHGEEDAVKGNFGPFLAKKTIESLL
ncbi:uncharacterized protein I303_100994 [Kwoniella dejecticola CBS 10117]|uniref:Uncharacterized protein n=1 Tax=Kwoniella dejecticola CBS 10117 TaxID=1296121 RepID=A0A1A6AGH4_9TREE|nr:uncharacterized protein I303_00998 [Kwoniella dejecticola CBS 10117]OBR89175.1 hypothetical protein I303_00998 [Kwoniella dejecticola CBS 10117]